MDEFFYIMGARIPIASIKDFQIVQREYIYRPTYIEAGSGIFGKRFRFYKMQPYAAIIGDTEKHSAVSQYDARTLKNSLVKDVFEDIRTTVGDKFNIKAIRSTKYQCINQTGRTFMTYLEDVPALIMSADGKASDVHKNDELYSKLGEPIAPAINIVHALTIKANQKYIFYGNGIQIEDIASEFGRLKEAVDSYNAEKKSKAFSSKMKSSIGKLIKHTDKPAELPRPDTKQLEE